jgi:chromate reductase, NAD(P)H dehydrogenase (quinone)
MMDSISVLGIVGSLRGKSFNRMILRAACELVPDGMTMTRYERLGDIPLYNEDVRERGFPEAVIELREAIATADALLAVTPEYNYSVPGVLKNALDWASRPPQMPFAGKPVAILGASSGLGGTLRAQLHLRQILAGLGMHVLNRPEVLIRDSAVKFDADGRLTDDETRDRIRRLLERLLDWTLLLKPGHAGAR